MIVINRAFANGVAFERQILQIYKNSRYRIKTFNEWINAKSPTWRTVVYQYPYENIYGGRGYVDFLVFSTNDCYSLELKTQNKRGSADEKIEYHKRNAAEKKLPGSRHLLVTSGDGFKPGMHDFHIADQERIPGFVYHRFVDAKDFLDNIVDKM